MAIQLDLWSLSQIETLEKRIASLTVELMNLREENRMLSEKRQGKRALIAYYKMSGSLAIENSSLQSCSMI